MGIAAGLAAAAAATSLAGGISGMTGGGNSPSIGGAGGGSPFLYQPTGQPQQDQNLQQIINMMFQTGMGLPQQLLPGYETATNNIINNPYSGLSQWGGNEAAFIATGMDPSSFGGGGGGAPFSSSPNPGVMHSAAMDPAAGIRGGPSPSPIGGGSPFSASTTPGSTHAGAPTLAQAMQAFQNAYPNGYPMPGGGNIPISAFGSNLQTVLGALSPQDLQAQVNMLPGGGTQAPAAASLPQQQGGIPINVAQQRPGGQGVPPVGPPGGLAGRELSAGNTLFDAGNNILQMAGNPQSALYNRLQNQLTQQINAQNAMSGVQGPAAAGVAQQGLTNFNIDWQNALLGRNIAAQGAAGRDFAGGSDLGNMAMQTVQQGSQAPYATYLGQQQDIMRALQGLSQGATQAFSLPQQTASNIQSYLGLGQSAGANALAGQQQGFQQGQTNLNNIGQALGDRKSVV